MIEVHGATLMRDALDGEDASLSHDVAAPDGGSAAGGAATPEVNPFVHDDASTGVAIPSERPVLSDVTVSIAPGELVALVGENGAGKSTLANLMCASLVAQPGMVVVDGVDPAASDDARLQVRRMVGHVFQQPEDQIVSTAVFDEVAFGPRNLGLDEAAVERAVMSALSCVGLAGFEDREVSALSGGEQQRLALASVLSCEPSYVVLDEVTSQLDSTARPTFRSLFRALAYEQGRGVVQVTHDPLEALMCDRVLVMEGGKLVWEGTPSSLVLEHRQLWDATLPSSAYASALCEAVERGYDLTCGVEPDDLVKWLQGAYEGSCSAGCPGAAEREAARAAVTRALDRALATTEATTPSCEAREHRSTGGIEAHGVSFSYIDPRGKTAPHEVLHKVDIKVAPGSITLVAGRTGSGKSTLLSLIAGLEEPQEGVIAVGGSAPQPGDVAVAFQSPERQLFLESVASELTFGPRNLGCSDEEAARRAEDARVRCGVSRDLMARDPFALSGGQARRVAIASVLSLDARALVLDEPTSGLDARGRRDLHALVRSLASEGTPVVVVSHDLEEWLQIASHVVLMSEGGVAWQGTVSALAQEPCAFAHAGLCPPEAWTLRLLLARAGSMELCAKSVSKDEPHALEPAPVDSHATTPAKPQQNPVQSVDTRVKLALLLALTVALFASSQPVTLVLWAVLVCVALRLSDVRLRYVLRSLRPLGILFAIVMVVNLVSLDGTADLMLVAPFGLSFAGAARAALAMSRILILVGAALVVSETSTPTQLADACVRLLKPLGRLGAPVGALGLVLSLALRFIPMAMEEVMRISMAQQARGVRFDEGSVVQRVQLWAAVLVPAVVSLFRRADRVAESMDARCYEAGASGELPPRPLAPCDKALLVGGIALMVAVVVLMG